MKCPVCGTECGVNTICQECGFDGCNKAFVNREEAELWQSSILKSAQIAYYKSEGFDNWRIILDYIDYYIYSFDEDKLIIQDGPDKEKAKVLYTSFINHFSLYTSETSNSLFDKIKNDVPVYHMDFKKLDYILEFELGLDFIRNLSIDGREYYSNLEEPSFSNILYIVNNILKKTRRGQSHINPEDVAWQMLEFVITILNPNHKPIF